MDSSGARSERMFFYGILAVLTIGLVVWSLVAFEPREDTPKARSKAAELAGAFEQAGLQAPSEALVVRTLGEDGGVTCANADNDLN